MNLKFYFNLASGYAKGKGTQTRLLPRTAC
jgi:hypothetical protein